MGLMYQVCKWYLISTSTTGAALGLYVTAYECRIHQMRAMLIGAYAGVMAPPVLCADAIIKWMEKE
jgi:hypothetical protein